MPIELYGMQPSAPVRSVAMTLGALGLEYEFKKLDLQQGEHLKPEYVKVINNFH